MGPALNHKLESLTKKAQVAMPLFISVKTATVFRGKLKKWIISAKLHCIRRPYNYCATRRIYIPMEFYGRNRSSNMQDYDFVLVAEFFSSDFRIHTKTLWKTKNLEKER